VQPLETPLTDCKQVSDRSSQIPGIVVAALLVEGQAIATSPFRAAFAQVRGMRPRDLAKLSLVADNIKQGSLEGFDGGQGIAVGQELADQLSIRAGDKITLVAPRGAVTPMGTVPQIKAYNVAAVFKIGMAEYDSTIIFMPLAEAQLYFKRNDDVTAIEVYTSDPDRVDRFRRLITDGAGRQIFMIDWRQRD